MHWVKDTRRDWRLVWSLTVSCEVNNIVIISLDHKTCQFLQRLLCKAYPTAISFMFSSSLLGTVSTKVKWYIGSSKEKQYFFYFKQIIWVSKWQALQTWWEEEIARIMHLGFLLQINSLSCFISSKLKWLSSLDGNNFMVLKNNNNKKWTKHH